LKARYLGLGELESPPQRWDQCPARGGSPRHLAFEQ